MKQFNNKSGQTILDSFQTDHYMSFITKMERKTLIIIFNTYKYLIIIFLEHLIRHILLYDISLKNSSIVVHFFSLRGIHA